MSDEETYAALRTIGVVLLAMAIGAAAAFSLPPAGLGEVISDLAFVMAMLGASVYWSALILLGRMGDAGTSPIYAKVVLSQVRYSLRTFGVAVFGVCAIGVSMVIEWAGWSDLAGPALNFVVVSAFSLFVIRLLGLLGRFQTLLDARMDAIHAANLERQKVIAAQ